MASLVNDNIFSKRASSVSNAFLISYIWSQYMISHQQYIYFPLTRQKCYCIIKVWTIGVNVIPLGNRCIFDDEIVAVPSATYPFIVLGLGKEKHFINRFQIALLFNPFRSKGDRFETTHQRTPRTWSYWVIFGIYNLLACARRHGPCLLL